MWLQLSLIMLVQAIERLLECLVCWLRPGACPELALGAPVPDLSRVPLFLPRPPLFPKAAISGRALRRANPANYSAVLRGSWVTFVLCFVLLASAHNMSETNHASLRAAVVPVIGYVLLLRHATFVLAGTLGGKGLGSDFTGRWFTLLNVGTLIFSLSFRFPPPIKLVMSAVLTVYWTKYILPKVRTSVSGRCQIPC